ncbi:DUF185-domain-containing protein [Polyplosphaeria fusca]|uniref:Protein arginine methyltransferase NDUFAF7 n=1 Tax=Polyplosphaeria fusca TaxID=682080 RepID=A0A9P4V2B7_9PLEO|nr:DUF185-domain-containing protein [Polyplosphaeria fusca]
MRQCLTAPEGGYYTRQTEGHDQFGAKGDFITSPEISQVFGELIGIWLYTEWVAQGKPTENVQIIEVGPGRGTLMADVLRTISVFDSFSRSVSDVYLVEASPYLRDQQAKLLTRSKSLHGTEKASQSKILPGVNITWCDIIKEIPPNNAGTPFIIAHEFFDALPIHVFQNSSSAIPKSSTIITPTGPIKPRQPIEPTNQWHELLISPKGPSSTLTTTTSVSSSQKHEQEEFQLTLSKSPTAHSLLLPKRSQRYKSLSNTPDAIIEISPESLDCAAAIATRIGGSPSSPKHKASGAALILDYGPKDTIPANTLRGIRAHRPASPLSSPGLVDLSADVDFIALAESALDASPNVEVHGPVEQAFFLETMGIRQRAEKLVEAARAKGGPGDKELEENVKSLEGSWKRLVDRGPQGMGRLYKAMAIVPYNKQGVRRPVGFGGDFA